MANQNFFFAKFPVMKSVAQAVVKTAAGGTTICFCPVSVSERLKPVLPDLEKLIGVNISLRCMFRKTFPLTWVSNVSNFW